MAGPVNTPDKASSGILSHTLFVVVSTSMKIAIPATSRRMAQSKRRSSCKLLKPVASGR
jgi:hypothetical protein